MPHPRLSLVLLASSLAYISNSPVHAQTPSASIPVTELVGNYWEGGGCGGTSITLDGDGHYKLVVSTDYSPDIETDGDYTFAGGVLTLAPDYKITSENPKNPQVRTRTPVSDPIVRYLPVRWGQRMYLLSQGKQEIAFCNAVNLGDEPALSFHPFIMGSGDEKRPVKGQPELPTQWRDYLLLRPVKAKVVWIQKDKSVIVNVGSANNIRVGMQFTNNRRRLNDYTVVSVTAHRAVLKAYETPVRIGSALSTRRTYCIWKR